MPPRPLPLPLALLLVVVAGGVLVFAFPNDYLPVGIWPIAFVVPVAVLRALQGRRLGAAALVGAVFGYAFYLPHITWMTQFLRVPGAEWVPWVALSTAMAIYWAIGAMLISLAYRWMPRAWRGAGGALLLLPVAVAGLWTAREALNSVWPFGGFAWGRLGLSQAQSPIAPVFSWLGVSGVTFVIVFLAAFTLAAWQRPPSERGEAKRPSSRLRLAQGPTRLAALAQGPALALTAALGVLVAAPAFPTQQTGTIRVAAIQGDGLTAYFDERPLGENLQAQVSATLPVLDPDLDVVLWPEGGSDLDPTVQPYARQVFDAISERASAPLVSGIVQSRGDLVYNTSIVWQGGGVLDHYDKKHPVPFGEYVPERPFFRALAPDLIDLIARDYTPGTTDQVLAVPVPGLGDVLATASICFDIVDDRLQRQAIQEGSQVIFAQSNNGDFGHTAEGLQQLDIARIRAIESGRAVVNISTVGTSAIILPDGTEIDRLTWYQPGAMVDDVPLHTGVTPGILLGGGIELLVSLLGLGALAAALGTRMGLRRFRGE